MTIAITGAGSWGVRTGHLFGRIADLEALRGGTATARVLTTANVAANIITLTEPDYANGTPLPQVIDGIPGVLASFQASFNGSIKTFAGYCVNTLLAMYAIDQQGANADGPLSQLTSGFTLAQAMQTLVTQMIANSQSVQAATVTAGAQTAAGTPTGNAVIVVSVVNQQGLTLQLVFPETLTFACSRDSQTGGMPPGNEAVTVLGQAAVSDVWSQLYPGGSGSSNALRAVDGSKSQSTGNLLQNSDFFTATTANVADNFTIRIGAAGVDVFQTTSSANVYTTGGGALEFLGTGAGLLDAVTQDFGTAPSTIVGAGGTTQRLLPDTVYHGNLWFKLSGASPATGVLELALTDGSAYPSTVLQNDQAASQLVTKSLTSTADTNWHNFSFAFQTPAVLPTTTPVARLRLRLSTAIESGKGVFIGRLSLTPATQLYRGGPFASVHSGNVRLIAGLTPDTWTSAIANNYQTTAHGLFQAYSDRVFGLRALGLQLPYANSPTLADTVIA